MWRSRTGGGNLRPATQSDVPREEITMAFRINHIHLKAPDPRKTAEWYEKAFMFKIVSDETRVFGDRFIRCQSEDGGMAVNISGARTNETLGSGDASAHHGLEHFGFDTEDIEADIARLEKLGARLLEGPIQNPNGPRIAFLKAPDDVRVELVERRKIAGGSGCGC
jgi:catechol 2,3-dioxygenase-like lactoylglutathione lyase family enzyme